MSGPTKKWKHKGIELTAWDGKFGPQYSLKKTYKDKNTGEYKEAKFFFQNEIAAIAEMFNDADHWIRTGEDRVRPEVVQGIEVKDLPPVIRKVVESVVDDLDIPF